MRVVSWNVNGLRACANKGFLQWLGTSRADIVGVQEVRARVEDLPEGVRQPRGWNSTFVAGVRRGYSGVGLFSREPPDKVDTSLGVRRFDDEARVQLARFGKLLVANVYFPNGHGKDRDNSRVPYKLSFYRRLFKLLACETSLGGRVIVMGDFNTAHREIDLARPKENVDNSGFRPEERRELDRWLKLGWVDTFRHFETRAGHYSWWSNRAGSRERNVGWRIDYVLASAAALPFVRGAFISPKVMGSDHCPVGIDVDDAIVE
ncbi:MAG: exodeoxyribonuclease III [Myxococcales bacterium]|nr:exodeoxyribonuclease III [Myxococcales bacterium]